MIDPVTYRGGTVVKRDNIIKTGDVEAELVRVTASLVMRVDPAGLAKIVLGSLRAPLIKRQVFFT